MYGIADVCIYICICFLQRVIFIITLNITNLKRIRTLVMQLLSVPVLFMKEIDNFGGFSNGSFYREFR